MHCAPSAGELHVVLHAHFGLIVPVPVNGGAKGGVKVGIVTAGGAELQHRACVNLASQQEVPDTDRPFEQQPAQT